MSSTSSDVAAGLRECKADKLNGIADTSVEVVVTRASIAHVADKTAATREFFCIVRPGGRLSIQHPMRQ
jgi:ubiquinone/menaquinone biosynthesis C-methylase UbiE